MLAYSRERLHLFINLLFLEAAGQIELQCPLVKKNCEKYLSRGSRGKVVGDGF